MHHHWTYTTIITTFNILATHMHVFVYVVHRDENVVKIDFLVGILENWSWSIVSNDKIETLFNARSWHRVKMTLQFTSNVNLNMYYDVQWKVYALNISSHPYYNRHPIQHNNPILMVWFLHTAHTHTQ